MSKEIWCEPVLGRNQERIIRLCQKGILSGRETSFIYLVATGPLRNAVTARILDKEEVRGCGTLQVFLFDGLVRKILQEARVERKPIEDSVKYFLIERVLGQLARRQALKYVPDIAVMPGCVQAMGALIGELKRAGKRPDEFREFLREFGGSYRDEDLAETYQAYQNVLERNALMDNDEAYLLTRDLLIGRTQRPAWLDRVQSLYIDGFFDFTPIQGQIIAQLVKAIPNVVVNLSLDERNPNVFVPVDETLKFFEKLGFAHVLQATETILRHPALDALPANLFNPDPHSDQEVTSPPISITSLPDISHEVQYMAKQIKRLLLEEGYHPSQIAIILRDPSKYVKAIQRIFADESIPYTLDMNEGLTKIPAVKAALKILDCRLGGELIESFAALLKNDYINPFSPIDPDAADNALVAVGIDLSTKDWLERARRLLSLKQYALEEVKNLKLDPEDIALEVNRIQLGINELEAAISLIREIRERLNTIPDKGTIPAFVSAFEEILKEFKIRENVKKRLAHAVRNERDLKLIVRDLKGLRAMSEAMSGISNFRFQDANPDTASEQDEIEVAEFKALLGNLLGRTEIRIDQGDPQGVSLLAVTQARGLVFRAVFLAGLTEGQFPQTPTRDWVYPYGERKKLADCGLYLEDLSPVLFQRKEEHFFYQCVCQATDYLYLSFPRTFEENEETIVSSFLEEVRERFGSGGESNVPVKTVIATAHEVKQISSRSEVAQTLLTNLWQASPDESLLLSLYNYALERGLLSPSIFMRLRIERERQGNHYGVFDGVIQDPNIQKQLQQQFSRGHIYSLTQFNTYAACPFKFFCQRILRLNPRSEASIDLVALDRGRLLHEILHKFFSKYTNQSLSRSMQELYLQEIRDVAYEVFSRYEKVALPLHLQIWELEKAEIIETLSAFIEHEIDYQEQVAPSGTQPYHLELDFGLTKKDGHLQFKRNSDVIKVRGRIDRVDRSQDGKYVAYDYKSSSGYDMREMRMGTDLQIPLYILALRKLFLKDGEEIVGGGYYLLKDGKRTKGLYLSEYATYTGISKRAESNIEREEWEELLQLTEERLWQYVYGIRRGDFRVRPKLPIFCPHCDYRTVCRYNKQRIQSKIEE